MCICTRLCRSQEGWASVRIAQVHVFLWIFFPSIVERFFLLSCATILFLFSCLPQLYNYNSVSLPSVPFMLEDWCMAVTVALIFLPFFSYPFYFLSFVTCNFSSANLRSWFPIKRNVRYLICASLLCFLQTN